MAVVSTDLEVFEDETTRVGFKVYIRKDIDDIPELRILSKEQRLDMKAVSARAAIPRETITSSRISSTGTTSPMTRFTS